MTAALPVADRWFETTTVDSRITRIHEPFVDELLQANAWHVAGRDRQLLIDTGLGVGSIRAELPWLTEPDPIVVLTHAHLDHMGSAHEFAGCWAHRAEAVTDPPAGSLRGAALAAELGLGETLPPLLISAVPHAGYDPDGYRLSPARITRWMTDGDEIDLGDRRFSVLHLPGHSPGGLALFDRADGTLFGGDVIYDDVLLDDIVGADRARYRASLNRLRALPVQTVHPGHGPSFGGQRLRELIDAYLGELPTTGRR